MTVVSRLYDDYSDAARAVSELERVGIPHSDISIVANNADGWYSEDGRPAVRDRDGRIDRDRDGVDDRAEGAAAGAGIGAALGGTAGLLAGLGLLAIPGLGPVVAAGWLASTAALAVAGGATGGLIGALTQSGVSEEEANVYAEGVRRGGNLVTVRTDDSRSAEVEAIMLRHNAANTDERAATYRAGGWDRYDDTTDPSSRLGTAAGVGTTTAAGQMGTRTGAYPRTDASLVGGPPDGTPGNPPGTKLSRGVDEVAGTNISGAHPENEAKGATGSTTPGTATGGVTGNPRR